MALAVGDHPARPWQPWVATTDWIFVRFHFGRAAGAATTARAELRELAPRVAALAGDGYVYFNNDWEGFAVKNALRTASSCWRRIGS